MSVEDMKNYLLPLDIPPEGKRYALNFCKKIKYMEGLRRKAATDTGSNVSLGYGDINSKICFIFQSPNELGKIKNRVQSELDKYSINFWQVWTTFIDKTNTEYPDKLTLLAYEINAVNPTIIYFFGDNEDIYNDTINSIYNCKPSNLQKHFFIDINDLGSDNPDIKSVLWKKMHYLINYQTIDK